MVTILSLIWMVQQPVKSDHAKAHLATCYGKASCRACKTCEHCLHCSVGRGTCGVCKPRTRPVGPGKPGR